MDGAENNPPSFHTSKHYEICKYYILTEHSRPPDVLVISAKVWSGLLPELQRALKEAVDESVVEQRRLWAAAVERAFEAVEAASVEVVRLDPAPFRAATEAVWTELEDQEIGRLGERIRRVE